MDTSHEYASGDVGEPPAAPSKSKPKLFSMARSHALLESKRLNTSQLLEQPNFLNARMRMDPAPPQRKTAAQAAPRISLSHLLSNHTSARTSTPVSAPRSSAPAYNTERRENDKENVTSSPGFTSYESPDRAYIQQNRPFSDAPASQSILQLSALQRAPQTPRQQANDSLTQSVSLGSIGKSQSQGKFQERELAMNYFSSALSENQQLHADNQHLEAMNAQLSRDLEDYRSNLNVINAQLSSSTAEVKTLRPALASAREQLAVNENENASLKASCSNTKAELDSIQAEHTALKEEHTQERFENDRLRANVETAKKGIAKLLIEYATLGENFREMKKGYDAQKSLCSAMVKEVEETKTLAKSGLSALEPMLDDNNTMARAEDTKIVLKELHDDLLASQQVTDLLRNKLHHQSSQLADAHSRIKELEEDKRGALKELLAARQDAKREYEMLVVVEGRVGELSTRLLERERESFDALANAAVGQVDLKAAKEQLDRYRKENELQALELVSLRKVKEENVSSLLALQDVINARDKEIVAVKADIKALNESKSELRVLLAENKKNLAETESDLRAKETIVNARERDKISLMADCKALMESKAELQSLLSETKKSLADKVVELKTRDPNEDLLIKIQGLETTRNSLKEALEDSQEQCILGERSLKQLEMQLTKKQQDAEKACIELASMNKSLKELSSKVQDQLKNVQDELKEALITASTAKGKCSALENAQQDSCARHKSLLAELEMAKVELKTVQEELKSASVKASNATGKCSILEANIKKVEKENKTAREGLLSEIANLNKRLEIQSVSLFQAKEACSLSKEESATLKERVVAAGDQREALQLALNNAQLLVKAEEKRALTAENAAAAAKADAKESLAKLESKVTYLTRELADAQKAANKMEHSANSKNDEHIKRLEKKITELEETNQQLSAHADELWARYKDGALTDKEKEFIGYLMNEAQTIHDEDVIRKDNELRRREHAIQALNTKNSELQTVVARLIKNQANAAEISNKSLVDVKTWLASSPEHAPSENDADVPEAPAHENKVRPLREMDADSEDDIPLSELSKMSDDDRISKKRIRPSSPPAVDEPSQSKRRTKNSTGQRASITVSNVAPLESKATNASVVKYKSKKQRK